MRVVNRFGVPETIVNAINKRNALYDKGDVHRSVTQLVNSPRVDLLRKKHFSSIEIDASQEFWPLLGSAVHSILELGATENQIIEERIFAEIDGWKLSGAVDVQEENEGKISIYDYKVCTLFSVRQNDNEGKWEWTAQQNIYRWLVESTKGKPVEKLFIVAIIRDWQNSGKLRDPFYPPSPIMKIPIEMWSMDETEAFIRERINAHRIAEMTDGFDGELPECTSKDRWERGARFNIKKRGGKRASYVYDNFSLAEAHLKTLPDEYIIEQMPGENVRCEGNYCQVAEHCSQFARLKSGGKSGQ